MFDAIDYQVISSIVFKNDYPGYDPNVIESPNGDGNYDKDKRYAHVAVKYLSEYSNMGYKKILKDYLERAHEKALSVAISLGVPREFWPDYSTGAMRILEYPPGSITNPHVDFDLFTLMLYRNIPECFKYLWNKSEVISDGHPSISFYKQSNLIHSGEILELIIPELKADKHEVIADPYNRNQYSIVYFAIPPHESILPDGQTVKEWLDERLSRSRLTVEPVKSVEVEPVATSAFVPPVDLSFGMPAVKPNLTIDQLETTKKKLDKNKIPDKFSPVVSDPIPDDDSVFD